LEITEDVKFSRKFWRRAELQRASHKQAENEAMKSLDRERYYQSVHGNGNSFTTPLLHGSQLSSVVGDHTVPVLHPSPMLNMCPAGRQCETPN